MQSSGIAFPTRGIEKGHVHLDTVSGEHYTYKGGDPHKIDESWEKGIVVGLDKIAVHEDTAAQLVNAQVQLKEAQERYEKLAGEQQETLGKLITAESSKVYAQEQFEQISKELKVKNTELGSLREQYDQLQRSGQGDINQVAQLQKQLESAQQEISTLQEKLNTANADLQQRHREYDQVKNQAGALENELQQAKGVQEITAQNLKNVQDRLQEQINVNTQSNVVIGKLKDRVRALEPLEERIKDRDATIKGLEEQRGEHTEQILSLRDSVRQKEHETNLHKIKAENLAEQAGQVEALLKETAELRETTEATKKASEEQQRRDLAANEALKSDLQTAQELIKDQEKSISALQLALDAAVESVDKGSIVIIDLKAEIENLKGRLQPEPTTSTTYPPAGSGGVGSSDVKIDYEPVISKDRPKESEYAKSQDHWWMDDKVVGTQTPRPLSWRERISLFWEWVKSYFI